MSHKLVSDIWSMYPGQASELKFSSVPWPC